MNGPISQWVKSMNKIELLAPAGDLEKAKIALLYGADAVYVGGETYSLRARAGNLKIAELAELSLYAHAMHKQVYVTINIIPRNEDLDYLDPYLIELAKTGIDAIIVSSPFVIERAKALTHLPIHLSTQQSVTTSALVQFYANQGVSRVVLARELSLLDIQTIRQKTSTELEVFIHGGLCSSYSGRCTLSNHLSLRDANRGGCAHSCRWEYRLLQGETLISDGCDFRLAAKDLEAVDFIPELIKAGVASLKIEGRMKSLHYIATVVKTYRTLIDDCLANNVRPSIWYRKELARAENRPTAEGFLGGVPQSESLHYGERSTIPSQEFVGIVIGPTSVPDEYVIEQRNRFFPGVTLEVFSPNRTTVTFSLESLKDQSGNTLSVANHARQLLRIVSPIRLESNDLLRKVN